MAMASSAATTCNNDNADVEVLSLRSTEHWQQRKQHESRQQRQKQLQLTQRKR